MNISQIYIAIVIVILAVIFIRVFFTGKKRKEKRLTPLASLAFASILTGIFFGEEGFIGYGLIGAGVLLAVVDIFNKSKQKE